MAHVGTFYENFIPKTTNTLRSHSLLHFAVARGDVAEIEKQVQGYKLFHRKIFLS